jgi:ribonuclease BN (tRNA processing enzyme)
MLDAAYLLHEFTPGARFGIGPFAVTTRSLPHWVPNAGIRLTAGGQSLAYTGDTGPCPDITDLARDADVLIAEATYAEEVPEHSAKYLSSAEQAGQYAAQAHAGRLLLTHLWPGSDPHDSVDAARQAYDGDITVADSGLVIDLH